LQGKAEDGMRLRDLLQDVVDFDTVDGTGWPDLEVTSVQDDSRRVGPNTLFVAIPGLRVDGHDFVVDAVKRGAKAVVAGRMLDLDVPCVVVRDPARALALSAARLAGEPARSMQLLGITGTNGKTTTTYVMEQILRAAGRSPGVIGTVAYRFGDVSETAPYTTPTPLVLQQVLTRMRQASCSDVVMEVSSHALELGRVWGLSFAVAAFTHLTQDHLDLHGSMEAYLAAKLLLFQRHLRPGGTAVVNLDGAGADAVLRTVRERGDVRLVGCSCRGAELGARSGGASLECGVEHARGRAQDVAARLVDLRQGMEGLRGRLELGSSAVDLRSSLIGDYNADNILMAAACCHAVGVPIEAVARGVQALTGVPGRLERVTEPASPFTVLVDYAHTPDALERAMGTLRPLCPGRLVVVFGCGGDRDRTKRPLMGRAVARLADLFVVTSDNPRTEDPQSIIEGVLDGVRGEDSVRLQRLQGDRGHVVEPDRRQAIVAAVTAARPGDIVLIAGKGHEDYQILGPTRIHFDDREQAREALARR